MRGMRGLYLLGAGGMAVATATTANAQTVAPATTPSQTVDASQQPATQATTPIADSESSTLHDVVVTANKRQENINRVGLSVTAIGSEALAERRITSVQDIAAAVPGLKFAESGTNTPIFTLRGIGFNEESLGVYPSVSVYTDEVPLPFPVPPPVPPSTSSGWKR